MILLDTNVVSEMMKPDPDPAVRAWLNERDADTLYLSSVTCAELWFGMGVMSQGRRRRQLELAFEDVMALFDGRVLPFDLEAARCHADLAVRARRSGRGFPTPDGYIAAVAVSRGFCVVSRDVGPFEAAGVRVVNPWQRPGGLAGLAGSRRGS